MTLRVTFLGTAGAVPTTERSPSSIHVNRDGDQLLFDVGEGTQRQMMRYTTGFGISHIFITHLHGDHIYGLPGLLETWEFNDRSEPLTIHTPRYTRSDITALITACSGEPGYPVEINEVEAGDTAVCTDEYAVRAVRVNHITAAVGYVLVEDDRKGRFDRDAAERLGVPEGPLFGRLHEGESVTLEDGTVVLSEQVVGPPRPGRVLVYSGDTMPTETIRSVASGADLLIHDATFGNDRQDRAADTRHSTARQAARIAHDAGVRQLVLTHISSRYAGDASRLLKEAQKEFAEDVVLAHDGLQIEVTYPD